MNRRELMGLVPALAITLVAFTGLRASDATSTSKAKPAPAAEPRATARPALARPAQKS